MLGVEIVGYTITLVPFLLGIFGGVWVASQVSTPFQIPVWILCGIAGIFLSAVYASWFVEISDDWI
jgi:hypothetical protein